MIGDATLVITREQLVAIVQEWWKRSTYGRDVPDVGASRVVSVWLPEGAHAGEEVRIELEPIDAPSK